MRAVQRDAHDAVLRGQRLQLRRDRVLRDQPLPRRLLLHPLGIRARCGQGLPLQDDWQQQVHLPSRRRGASGAPTVLAGAAKRHRLMRRCGWTGARRGRWEYVNEVVPQPSGGFDELQYSYEGGNG